MLDVRLISPEDLRKLALEIEQEGEAALARQVDAALVSIFSDLEIFEKRVLPGMAADLAACEKDLGSVGKLGLREFLGLFST